MERYIVDVQVIEKDVCTSLVYIYKYLHPAEILKNAKAYRSKKKFIKHFNEDQKKYFQEFLRQRDSFEFQKLYNFFQTYPVEVWKWIEK